MDDDPYADMFQFRLGQAVRWAEHPRERYYVVQRRWTQRPILAPVVEYRLTIAKDGQGYGWVHAWDLQAIEPGEA